MNWRNILTVYGKELRDMLRDRRTIISMIVVPTFVMPALMGVIIFVGIKVARDVASTAPTVMVLGGEDSPAVRAALQAQTRVKIVPASENWRRLISDKKLRAVVEIPPGFDAVLERGERATIKVFNYEGELRSDRAVSEVRRIFGAHAEKIVEARLAERGVAECQNLCLGAAYPSYFAEFDDLDCSRRNHRFFPSSHVTGAGQRRHARWRSRPGRSHRVPLCWRHHWRGVAHNHQPKTPTWTFAFGGAGAVWRGSGLPIAGDAILAGSGMRHGH
jgi:hypothetical protein